MNHCSTLILVPTALELQYLSLAKSTNVEVQLCGFGLAISGIRCAQLIKELRPSRVLLIGVAGGYGSTCQLGTARSYSSVRCYGVGVGEGENYESAEEMGWLPWPGGSSSPSIADHIVLRQRKNSSASSPSALATTSSSAPSIGIGAELLSCTAASHSEEEADRRHEKFPQSMAEDMEGYAVAAACSLLNTPLSIVRGISNRAGHRDLKKWNIPGAMSAASSLAQELLNDW